MSPVMQRIKSVLSHSQDPLLKADRHMNKMLDKLARLEPSPIEDYLLMNKGDWYEE